MGTPRPADRPDGPTDGDVNADSFQLGASIAEEAIDRRLERRRLIEHHEMRAVADGHEADVRRGGIFAV